MAKTTADGLRLLPGDDGTLPVRVRWVEVSDGPEAIAVDGSRLYVMASELTAYNLKDGSVAWVYEDKGEGIGADGGVVIGLDGPDVVRVIAPYNYDIRVDRRTGRLLSMERDSDEPAAGFSPFQAPADAVRSQLGPRGDRWTMAGRPGGLAPRSL
ncbi:MAG: hypothetical protein WKF86_06785 [Acidimicrobiales bacterium]